jgi:hypothetical protein
MDHQDVVAHKTMCANALPLPLPIGHAPTPSVWCGVLPSPERCGASACGEWRASSPLPLWARWPTLQRPMQRCRPHSCCGCALDNVQQPSPPGMGLHLGLGSRLKNWRQPGTSSRTSSCRDHTCVASAIFTGRARWPDRHGSA